MKKQETEKKMESTQMEFNSGIGAYEFKLKGGESRSKYLSEQFVVVVARILDNGMLQGSVINTSGREQFNLSFEDFIAAHSIVLK